MNKIAIAGIGGVGGYFGGLLAKYYQNIPDIDIYFIARGENEKAIKQNGLYLKTVKGNFSAYPKMVTSNPAEIGPVDLLICCTKSYHLEQSLQQFAPCITPQTVLLPLLNGVNNCERIKALLPQNEVWQGCVYLVARLSSPGLITETGDVSLLSFGSATGSPEKLEQVAQIFRQAGISTNYSNNIKQTIWEKYLFISPVATLTSYLNATLGEIADSDYNLMLLTKLCNELSTIAGAVGIKVKPTYVQETIARVKRLPYTSTSSMHTDFQKGHLTELDTLTAQVIILGRQYALETPTYQLFYESLQKKQSNNM